MTDYLIRIKEKSELRYNDLKNEINEVYRDRSECEDICIFACGSMGRMEMTDNSDLDLFFIENSNRTMSDLDKYLFFGDLYKINKNQKYKEPSKGGEYWKFTKKADLLDIGSQSEDYKNSFTARLLLILESKPLFNDKLYNEIIGDTVDKYFCDYPDNRDDFIPLFMMNDILRYWYTLTLNYEFRRDANADINKKNRNRLKLKYARLITCFSLFLCLFEQNIDKKYVIDHIMMTPLERLEDIAKKNANSRRIIDAIYKEYEKYLTLRENDKEWWKDETNKCYAFEQADVFHDLVINQLLRAVASTNEKLAKKTELIF